MRTQRSRTAFTSLLIQSDDSHTRESKGCGKHVIWPPTSLNAIAAISSRFAIAPEILSLFLLLDLFRLSAATDPKSCYQLNKLITFGSPWDLSERIW